MDWVDTGEQKKREIDEFIDRGLPGFKPPDWRIRRARETRSTRGPSPAYDSRPCKRSDSLREAFSPGSYPDEPESTAPSPRITPIPQFQSHDFYQNIEEYGYQNFEFSKTNLEQERELAAPFIEHLLPENRRIIFDPLLQRSSLPFFDFHHERGPRGMRAHP